MGVRRWIVWTTGSCSAPGCTEADPQVEARGPRVASAVMVELTPRAHEALLTSQTAARRFDPEAHIRLTADGATVRALLASRPEPGDAVLEVGGLTIFVA